MSTIQILIQKRENLLLELAGLNHDLNEYSKNPVETVDLLGLKYQHDFTIREIKKIGKQINIFFNSQVSNYKNKFFEIEKKITEAVSKKEFTSKDLPKHHWSMFEDSNSLN
jgi:hypothetical protein